MRDAYEAPSRAPITTDPYIGELIAGRFRIEAPVSRGAMGAVYRATQEPLGRTVAVKILQIVGSHATMESHRARFLAEASSLARLSHPHTVRVIDYGVWEDHTYLVMEFIRGETLGYLFGRHAVSAQAMLRYAFQIVSALEEAHEEGIIHRDLKPSNVLVHTDATGCGRVKLVDFGLAKVFRSAPDEDDITASGTILGTPMYVSPEMIRQEPVDHRADLYAVGILLYRGLTGTYPFPRGEMLDVFAATVRDEPARFSAVAPSLRLPPVVEWTIRHCLAKNPWERFRDARELRRALEVCQIALDDPNGDELRLALDRGRLSLPDDIVASGSGALTRVPSVEITISATALPPSDTTSTRRLLLFAAGTLGVLLSLALYGMSQQLDPQVELLPPMTLRELVR